MNKPLKLYNGRGFTGRGDHLYIAAKNRTSAAKLVYRASWEIGTKNYPYREPDELDIGRWSREIRDYFNEGAWGNSMEGITPEVGVWYRKTGHEKPERII